MRDTIASGIEARDGYPVDPNDLFLTDGASPAVNFIYILFILIAFRKVVCSKYHVVGNAGSSLLFRFT